MRGSPLFRSLIALAVLLLLGWPLRRMLRSDAEASPEARPPNSAATPPAPSADLLRVIHLQVSFTTAPTHFSVLSLGKPVWTENAPGLELERDLSLAYPQEGVDLQFEVAWPAETRAAARVRLSDPAGGQHEQAIWGTGPTTEVLTFP